MNEDDIHRQFESFANEDVQVGEMPEWLHVRGQFIWYVDQGPTAGSAARGRRSWEKSTREVSRVPAGRATSTSETRTNTRPMAARR